MNRITTPPLPLGIDIAFFMVPRAYVVDVASVAILGGRISLAVLTVFSVRGIANHATIEICKLDTKKLARMFDWHGFIQYKV